MHRLSLTLFAAFLLASCSNGTGVEHVQIDVAVTPDRIAPGEIATIVVRLTNLGHSAVEIDDHCVSYFEVADDHGTVVAGQDPVICTLELRSPLRLRPFQTLERTGEWRGLKMRFVGNSWVSEPVPDGLYRVFGRLEGRRSEPKTIEVDAGL